MTGEPTNKKQVKKSPAYQLYASDHLYETSMMTAEQAGAFDRLKDFQWLDGSLPDDSATLRKMALDCSQKALDAILPKFPLCDDGRRRNAELETYRAEKTKWREKCSAGGKKSADVKKARSFTDNTPPRRLTHPPVEDMVMPGDDADLGSGYNNQLLAEGE